MAVSNFSGPVQITDVVASRPIEQIAVPLVPTAVASTDFTFVLPRCRIVALRERTNVAFTGATVTLQLGSTAGGVDYVAAVDIKAKAASRTLTQVDAAADVLDNFTAGTVFGRIAQTTPTAVGSGVLLVDFMRLGDG